LDEEGWQAGATLALAKEVEIHRYDIPTESYVLRHTASQVDVELDASFGPLWRLLDGHHTPSQVIDEFLGGTDADQHAVQKHRRNPGWEAQA
jgi:hypothetical protein